MNENLNRLSQNDPILKSILRQYGNPVIQVREQGFAALTHIILEQQVSIASAKATYTKLEQKLGKITSKKAIETTDEVFRECGVSRQKTAYIKDMAQREISGALDFSSFESKSVEEITSELLAIKGVGYWTIEVYLMFCLQHPDIIPLGDIAIRNTIKELYDIHEVGKMNELAQNWKPYRTLASYILWHHYLAKRNRL
ncbi:MAG: DNA-3-methyladenine glycosylase 2 family protein [Flavobacterium sp.]|uniref:DNA-3-methyladenine glycosylase family protein n=1 Tax=Flavobacterium sp. TaxID=239 RepID=UPI0012021DBD|nr:DNA-3-methyladenine glycosylase 2 family protein [Flavobacterium sp.]RZJ66448.1 MAG: DNA-3-methyladenine glycosylase 2 family protein [Flavobacterium sp.]